jgi:hypothetical protein
MSKFVKVKTQLRDLNLIKHALDDLKLTYLENANFTHMWSGFRGQVPLVVKVNHAQFGLRSTPEGEYEVIGDDMQMKVIQKELAHIQQRYAYHAVRQATAEAGFELVEENVGRDQVIRMTVRRWS